jgi:hypothetical protein
MEERSASTIRVEEVEVHAEQETSIRQTAICLRVRSELQIERTSSTWQDSRKVNMAFNGAHVIGIYCYYYYYYYYYYY